MTHIGINVVDSYELADFHGIINFTKKSVEKKMKVVRFAGILGHQLIKNAQRLSEGGSPFLSPMPQNCNLVTVPTNITERTYFIFHFWGCCCFLSPFNQKWTLII
jgi:hypothetical protein